MTFQNVLDTFFLRDDQDAFARTQGWEDAEQMCYYENLAMQAESMESEQLPPPPAVIYVHELANVDSREVYTDSEDCPNDGDFSEWASKTFDGLAGVY